MFCRQITPMLLQASSLISASKYQFLSRQIGPARKCQLPLKHSCFWSKTPIRSSFNCPPTMFTSHQLPSKPCHRKARVVQVLVLTHPSSNRLSLASSRRSQWVECNTRCRLVRVAQVPSIQSLLMQWCKAEDHTTPPSHTSQGSYHQGDNWCLGRKSRGNTVVIRGKVVLLIEWAWHPTPPKLKSNKACSNCLNHPWQR